MGKMQPAIYHSTRQYILNCVYCPQAWPLRGNDWVAEASLYDGSLYTLYFGKMPGVSCEFLAWHTPKNITHVVQISGPWLGEYIVLNIRFVHCYICVVF